MIENRNTFQTFQNTESDDQLNSFNSDVAAKRVVSILPQLLYFKNKQASVAATFRAMIATTECKWRTRIYLVNKSLMI